MSQDFSQPQFLHLQNKILLANILEKLGALLFHGEISKEKGERGRKSPLSFLPGF
jgi:hypothetical protein